MTSAIFMFVQLLAVATTCQASNEAALSPPLGKDSEAWGGFLSTLGLDQAVQDAFAEAFLALAVFGVVSALLGVYRRRTRKNCGPKKAPPAPPKSHAKKSERGRAGMLNGHVTTAELAKQPAAGSSTSTSALNKMVQSTCQRLPPRSTPPGLAQREPRTKQYETDALANAVRAGKASQLPELVDAAFERSIASAARHGTPDSENIASQLLLSSLRACAAGRCFREAIAAYEHMADRVGKGSAHLWSVLLYIIVETGTFHHSTHVVQELCSQASPSAHDFVNMVRCYASQRDPAGLRETLGSLQKSGHSVDAYTWNRALAACGASDCALDLAEELLSAGICNEGTDVVGYNTLMKYNARAGSISRCFELRQDMSAKGIEPSDVTFGILLDACVSAKELDRARDVFKDLCSSGLKLNVVHCTTFIKVLVAARLLDEAGKVLCEMIQSPGVKPDLITFSIVVKAYADNGDVSGALKMLELMLKEGVKPDEIVFNSVLTGCCTYPLKSSQVMRTFDMLIGHGMKPSTTTLSILLKGLAHTAAWPTALQVLKDSRKNFGLDPEPRLYAQVAQACVRAQEARTVLEVFDAMLQDWQRRGKMVDREAIGRFLRSCLLAGASDVAAELREKMQRSGITIDAQMEKLFKTAVARKA